MLRRKPAWATRTISTGAFPATHGMVANEWWDREQQKGVTCTSDPNVKNMGYGGASVKGGDSAARMLMPAFAEELKFQSGGGTRVVTFSLKARAAITMAGHQADAVTWFDPASGSVGDFERVSGRGIRRGVRKGASRVERLRQNLDAPSSEVVVFIRRNGRRCGAACRSWSRPFLIRCAGSLAVLQRMRLFTSNGRGAPMRRPILRRWRKTRWTGLRLGKGPGTDYLGVSFSSVDYVAHAFGPRSWEVQDELARLDRDLAASLRISIKRWDAGITLLR